MSRIEYTMTRAGLATRSKADTLAEARAWIAKYGNRRTRSAPKVQTKATRPTVPGFDPVQRRAWEALRVQLDARELKTLHAHARHEAGHAVAGYHRGLGIEHVRVTIESKYTRGMGPMMATGGTYRALKATEDPVVALAGPEAVELSGMADILAGWSDKDVRRAERAGDIEVHRALARGLLRRQWDAVERLALALVMDGFIPGDRAVAIIEGAHP